MLGQARRTAGQVQEEIAAPSAPDADADLRELLTKLIG